MKQIIKDWLRKNLFKSNKTTYIKSVKIGNQEWMVENLDVSAFNNGDAIPEARTDKEWEKFGLERKPAWCYYDNKTKHGKNYGKLYNWYAVSDSRNMAPYGWFIPRNEEWTELEEYLGKNDGNKMKSINGWKENGNGNNESGFSGHSDCARNIEGSFTPLGYFATWWSSTESNTNNAWYRRLGCLVSYLGRGENLKGLGFSVRCIKESFN